MAEGFGYSVLHGPNIAPGELVAERNDYGRLVLEDRLRDTALPKLITSEVRFKHRDRIIGINI